MTKVTISVMSVSIQSDGPHDKGLQRFSSVYEVVLTRQPDGQVMANFVNTSGGSICWGTVTGLLDDEENEDDET